MTGYVNALKLRFEDTDTKDDAYANLEKVKYEGCIHDMVTKIQTFNIKAIVTGAAQEKMILERLPRKILEQMHVVDLMGKTDLVIVTIITNGERTAEKWEATRKIFGLKASFGSYEKKHPNLERNRDKLEKSERRQFKQDLSERKEFR
jgi:hypothetical protein